MVMKNVGKPLDAAGLAKGKGKMQMMKQMMEMFAMMSGEGGNFGGKGGINTLLKQAAKTGPALGYKSHLQQAYAKTHKEVLTKETILYSTEKNDEGYECSISSEKFEQIYTAEGSTQKHAQENAAKAALLAEFPTFFKEADQAVVSVQKVKPTGGDAPSSEADHGKKLVPWKSQLLEAYSRKHGSVTKGVVNWATEKAEDPRYFVSTVSSDNFGSSYEGAPGLSKRFAEDNAALKAMEAEFPEAFKASQAPKTNKGWTRALKEAKKEESETGKRKLTTTTNDDPKTILNCQMNLLLKGPVSKGTVEYSTVEKDEKTVATVVITGLGPKKKFSGEAVDGTSKQSKKEAEGNAAEAASRAFKKQIDAAEEVQAKVKEERAEKKKADWAVMLAQKKEEKKAEQAAKAKA